MLHLFFSDRKKTRLVLENFPLFVTAGLMNYLYSYRGNHKSSFGFSTKKNALDKVM